MRGATTPPAPAGDGSKPLGKCRLESGCGSAETVALAPNGQCWKFPDTCIPDGWQENALPCQSRYDAPLCGAAQGGSGGGADGSVSCDAPIAALTALIEAHTECVEDADCQLVDFPCLPGGHGCTGRWYLNTALDAAEAERLSFAVWECTPSEDCLTCLPELPPAACIDGTCGPGEMPL